MSEVHFTKKEKKASSARARRERRLALPMVPHNYSADIPQRMHSRRSHPLFGALSIEETRVEERIRTLALCIMAAAVLGATLAYLRAVLVPLVLASATRYLLAFPVDLLTRRPMGCFGVELCAQPVHEPDAPLVVRCLSELFCRLVLPRPLAVLVTLGVTGLACSYIGVLLMDSLRTFSARADTYSEQAPSRVRERREERRGPGGKGAAAAPDLCARRCGGSSTACSPGWTGSSWTRSLR